MKTFRKILIAGLLLSAVAVGFIAFRRFWKSGLSPKKVLKKKQAELSSLLHQILQESVDDKIQQKLLQLKVLFRSNWVELMIKEDNYRFWNEWLESLSETVSDNGKEPADWNNSRKEKMKADLGSVKF